MSAINELVRTSMPASCSALRVCSAITSSSASMAACVLRQDAYGLIDARSTCQSVPRSVTSAPGSAAAPP
jgi:hypothetical protein